jgi:hypothetical protein
MEYRPDPKPKKKILLRRRPDKESDENDNLLSINDLTKTSEFDRKFIKEFERVIGMVQEKKRKEGEIREPRSIRVEPRFSSILEEDDEQPIVKQRRVAEEPEPEKPLVEAEPEPEPEKPLADAEAEPEPEPEPEPEKPLAEPEPAQVVAPGPLKKGRAKKVREEQALKIPKIHINDTTKINGDPVLARVPKPSELSKLVVRAPTYYMANRKIYTTKIANLFRDFSKELLEDTANVSCDRQGSTTNIDLLIHQRIVREYLNLYTPYRGLLLYHGLGSGKTCTSIAIAEAAKTHKRIFILTPASLKMNFFSELKKCGDSLYKKNQFWEFISVDGRPEYVSILSQVLGISVDTVLKRGGAWLTDIRNKEPNYGDLSPDQQQSLDAQLDEMIRAKYVDINYNGITREKFSDLKRRYGDPITENPFDHSVVLVDEAHNLVSRIVNNKKGKESVSQQIYEHLQSAQDVRVVFMSGTPIINYPNEMGVMFNMLRGYIKTWKITIPNTSKKLTPESIVGMFRDADFRNYDYIDYSNDVLQITRNPFGFINTKKPGAPIGKARRAKDLPKTVIIDEAIAIRRGGGKSKRKPSSQPSDKKTTRKNKKVLYPIADEGENARDLDARALALDTRALDARALDKDDIIRPRHYHEYQGALVLPKDIKINLSDSVKEQIAEEIHHDRNGNGPDPYHSGGATVVDDRYYGVHLNEQGDLSDVDFIERVKSILTENGVQFLPEIQLKSEKCLPDTQTEFLASFVNINTMTVQRPDVLKKRILGLSSYFRSAQESLLPSFVPSENELNPNIHVEYVEMSDHQFADYAKERTAEMSREKKPKTNADKNKEIIKTSGTYRTFTRAKCNFSFPAEIPRPMPSGMDPTKDVNSENLDNVRDDNVLDAEDSEDVIIDKEYDKAILAVIERLKTEQATYLTPEALQTYSPKFAKILANLKDADNRGLHLVYTAFRRLEGVGILKLILEANGFAEFKLAKNGNMWSIVDTDPDKSKPRFVLYTGTETAEEKEIVRNIYNSNWEFVPGNIKEELNAINANNYYGEIIKIIMITSSGAEGINLENTRFVHIVEPYWHMVRIDQVVGRARRICSHKNLPEEMRTIKVFLYMSTFSERQKSSRDNVKIMDVDVSRIKKANGAAKFGDMAITTDETLFEIAIIKDRLTKQLLKSVKESSVDCNVYDNSKEGLVCYTYGHTTSNEFGAFPGYSEDLFVREDAEVVEQRVKPVRMVINGKAYAHNPLNNELYNYEEYKKSGRVILEGNLKMVDGKPAVL